MSGFGGEADITATERNFNLRLPQKLGQLGAVGCNPAHLVFGEKLASRSPAPVIFEAEEIWASV